MPPKPQPKAPQPPAWRQWLEAARTTSSGSGRALELAVFLRELAVMLKAGIVVTRALEAIGKGLHDARLAEAVAGLVDSVNKGTSLGQAMKLYQDVFPAALVSIVGVGETSGRLSEVLARLATWQEQQVTLMLKVRSAMTYPAFMFALMLVLIMVMPGLLLQGIFSMLQDLHAQVPFPTRVLMGFSAATRQPLFWLVLAAAAGGLVVAARVLLREERHRLTRDRWLLRVPGMGPAFHSLAVASFSESLETMYSSGLSIVPALVEAGQASGNLVLRDAARQASEALKAGRTIDQAFRLTGFFTPTYVNLMQTGSEQGDLSTMLKYCARMAREDLDRRIEIALAAMEPLMLWVMGCVAGGIAVAALSPLLQVIQSLGLG